MPQQLTLDYKFKPFIPDYLPAVGDIDAFLKVVHPAPVLLGESFSVQEHKLGIAILDEPATVQSDSALLHLQLRASNLGVPLDKSDVVNLHFHLRLISTISTNTLIYGNLSDFTSVKMVSIF